MMWTAWILLLNFVSLPRILASVFRVVPWREPGEYLKDDDHFKIYVTKAIVPMVGEKALIDGCGENGRPYKYRGQKHVPVLREALRGVKEAVWVGAVATTTPWIWAGGGFLYQFVGFTSVPHHRTLRVPGNNAFLCALQCDNARYVLMQGNSCGCSDTLPDTLPASRTPGLTSRFRCPGTYDQVCGAMSAFSVYKSTLPEAVQWANLVDKQRFYGQTAFLYKPPKQLDNTLQLMAEANRTTKMGYICNGSSLQTAGVHHAKHVWAEHAPDVCETWRNARNMCLRQGRQLLELSRADESCIPEVEKEIKGGQGYWVALHRQNVSVWLDGTPMKESATYHRNSRADCLAMSLRDGNPVFTFDSCTGTQLQVLCEEDTTVHTESFTHDESGNHVTTEKSFEASDSYSRTVSVLVALLVILTVLSIVLVVCLCNRNKFLPPPNKKKKSLKSRNRTSNVRLSAMKQAGAEYPTGNVSAASTLYGNPEHYRHQSETKTNNRQSESYKSFKHDALGYAVVTKGKQTRLPPVGSDDTSTISQNSKSTDYTEVGPFVESTSDRQVQSRLHDVNFCMIGSKNQDNVYSIYNARPVVLTAESKEKLSVAGSEDTAYSVLSYRRAIQKAWVGLKRTAAYAHVIVRRPKKDESESAATHAETADVGVYDVTQPVAPRVPCIDNVYDHTELRVKVKAVTTRHGRDRQGKKKKSCDESVV